MLTSVSVKLGSERKKQGPRSQLDVASSSAGIARVPSDLGSLVHISIARRRYAIGFVRYVRVEASGAAANG